MTPSSLRQITVATIENYRVAAHQTTLAYGAGSRRLIQALNRGLEVQVDARAGKLAPQLTDAMAKARARVSDLVVNGIEQVARGTDKAVDLGSDGAVRQVAKVAEFAAGIDNKVVANGLQAAARLSLPAAQVALAVSGKLADGAQALSTRAGAGTVKARVVRARRTVAKQAKAAAAAPKKAVARARRAKVA